MQDPGEKLWRSLNERDGSPLQAPDANAAIRDQFLEPPAEGITPSRRSFLRLAGFGFAAATAAGCSRGQDRKAIPYLVPPEGVVPGKAYWMATTCGACPAGCGVLAKGRDGRPVKLEGNPAHPLSRGGLCAMGQADLLALYDSHRFNGPQAAAAAFDWERADAELHSRLEEVRAAGGRVRVLSGTLASPSARAAVQGFLAGFADGRHVEYDALSASAIREAHRRTHGVAALPRYFFGRARRIACFDADFLGTWISPVEHTAGWRAGRNPDAQPPSMSRHVQFEARLSLTGTRADERHAMAPWELQSQLAGLCRHLAAGTGARWPLSEREAGAPLRPELLKLADELLGFPGESLVVCGSDDPDTQAFANYANHLLGNYGSTLDLARPSLQRRGDDRALAQLLAELRAGTVDALIVTGCNPAYDLPAPEEFRQAVAGVGLVVSTASLADETSALAHYVLPEPHALEAWDDAEPWAGLLALRQPAIRPLRNGRSLRATLAAWMGEPAEERELLRDWWRAQVFPRQTDEPDFDSFFEAALQQGFVDLPGSAAAQPRFTAAGLSAPALPHAPARGRALVLYPKVGLSDGRHAHNPWLQELPDPVTKVVWDNYACLSPAAARELGIVDGDELRLRDESGGRVLELPARVVPGQHDQVVAVALGYGRSGTDRFSKVGPQWLQSSLTVEPGGTVGRNAAPFLEWRGESLRYAGLTVALESTGRRHELACTQDHHRLEVPAHLAPKGGGTREAVLATTLASLQKDPAHALPRHGGGHEPAQDLWQEDHAHAGHHWGMVIDLSACTGCSACVIACQAENNVPVVGKDEVRRHREMHWLRIDRYFHGAEDGGRAWHQPMMCQHCDHAPCETVCPVLATVHSREGLNQQVYNRCVGTRYCANNCPYKVRRFNWFDYPHEDRLQNMALNPDVTIRSRGVMEKCSMCVQRILAARIEARAEGRAVADGEIQTACQQSCPSKAIVFGDLADAGTQAAGLQSGARSYRVLDELNVRPSVSYLAAVSHSGPEDASHG